MGEDNKKSIIEKGIDKGKEYAKNKASNVIKKKVLYVILPYIGIFFIILLALGCILAVQFVIQDIIDSVLGIFSANADNAIVTEYSSDILEAAEQIYQEQKEWTYFTQIKGKTYDEQLATLTWAYRVDLQLVNKNKSTCCASYVACVLYATGYFTVEEMGYNFHQPHAIDEILNKAEGWIRIEDVNEIQPGDIVFRDNEGMTYDAHNNNSFDHVEIYAGDNYFYSSSQLTYKGTIKGEWNYTWAYRPTEGPKNPPATRTPEGYNGQIVSIDKDGSYKLNSKDLADDILEQLRSKKIDNGKWGFDINELENMIEKYIDAEVKTSFPQTEHPNNEIDGMIKIKRALAAENTDENKTKDLIYKEYEELSEMVDANNQEALNYFSINPKTLYLCIARNGNSTIKTKFDGTQVGEGDGMKLIEIDYRKYIQNNITPVNFFVALHILSQDMKFMQEFLEAATTKGGIELTYVDSLVTAKIEYDYDGKIYYHYSDDMSDEEKSDLDLLEFETLDYDTIKENYEDASEFSEIKEARYRGKMYVTNADTYLTNVSKKVDEMPTINTGGEGLKEEVVVDKRLQGDTVKVNDQNKNEDAKVEIERGRKLVIIEKTNTETCSITYKTDVKSKKLNVDKFLDLIKKYPKVEDNLTSAPSTLFYFLQQSEKTQRNEMIMRYVLTQLTDAYYGVDREDLEYLTDNFFSVSDGYKETIDTKIWYSLLESGYSEYAVAGIMGNIYQKSQFKSNDLEDNYENSLKYTDETYTNAINAILKPEKQNEEVEGNENIVENKVEPYTKEQFMNDQAGYGLALWSIPERKGDLYDFAKEKGVGIDDEDMQIQYLIKDLEKFQDDSWIKADNVEDATKAFYNTFIDPNEKDMTNIVKKAEESYQKFTQKQRSSFAGFNKGTKLIFNGKYFFPQYEQCVGNYPNPYGGPNAYGSDGTKTLDSSGCATFSMASIASGLLGMEINPVTYLDNLDEYFPGGGYYSYGVGSGTSVFDAGLLKKYYGLSLAEYSASLYNLDKLQENAKDFNGQCAIIGYRPGHYIAFVPALDNLGYKFYVIDSIGELTGGYTSLKELEETSGYSIGVLGFIYY